VGIEPDVDRLAAERLVRARLGELVEQVWSAASLRASLFTVSATTYREPTAFTVTLFLYPGRNIPRSWNTFATPRASVSWMPCRYTTL
jgi:hypothetical protein